MRNASPPGDFHFIYTFPSKATITPPLLAYMLESAPVGIITTSLIASQLARIMSLSSCARWGQLQKVSTRLTDFAGAA